MKRLLLVCLYLCGTASLPASGRELTLSTGTGMQVEIYPGTGEAMLLWLASEHGLPEGLTAFARAIREQGTEFWLVDPYSSWFLHPAPSSLDSFDTAELAELIGLAAERTGKKVYLGSNDKASRVLLRAARELQLTDSEVIAGAVLVTPDLFARTPAPGQPARFAPITAATNLPVMLVVAEKSTLALRWQQLGDSLRQGGSTVFTQMVKEVRDRFFFRPDATPQEQAAAGALPAMVAQSLLLLGHDGRPRRAVELAEVPRPAMARTQALLPFGGDPQPPEVGLMDLAGRRHGLADYRGKVVIVHFWASWCPPCVHEMPMMVRLLESYREAGLEVLAVNLGESPAEIETFLEQMPVNFTILLDPAQSAPRRWQVYAFPTSFVVDRDGRIRYSVAGALDWTSDAVKEAIASLLR